MGERPAILSRGYARRDRTDGVVVVRDPRGIRADLDRAGDEPLMLARRLHGVSVLVSPSRYLAGVVAERHLGATVHVLDDGFQHFDLHRDVDIVAVAREDVEETATLPGGRLREPLDAARAADAFVALDDDVAFDRLGAAECPRWRVRRRLGDIAGLDRSTPVVAVAGIAGPARFFEGLRAAGWTIARELPFADHHRFTASDVEGMFAAARASGAAGVITTEKDMVRLLPFRPFQMAVAFAPLVLEMDGGAEFDAWLRARLSAHVPPVGSAPILPVVSAFRRNGTTR